MRPVTDLQRRVAPFEVITEMVPAGDQPQAIAAMERGVRAGAKDTVLLGATGTGKTATIAWRQAMVAVLPVPVAPSSTVSFAPARTPRSIAAMACGWSPAGTISVMTSNGATRRCRSVTGRMATPGGALAGGGWLARSRWWQALR